MVRIELTYSDFQSATLTTPVTSPKIIHNSPVGDLNTRPSRPRRAVLPAELTEDIIAYVERLERSSCEFGVRCFTIKLDVYKPYRMR